MGCADRELLHTTSFGHVGRIGGRRFPHQITRKRKLLFDVALRGGGGGKDIARHIYKYILSQPPTISGHESGKAPLESKKRPRQSPRISPGPQVVEPGQAVMRLQKRLTDRPAPTGPTTGGPGELLGDWLGLFLDSGWAFPDSVRLPPVWRLARWPGRRDTEAEAVQEDEGREGRELEEGFIQAGGQEGRDQGWRRALCYRSHSWRSII